MRQNIENYTLGKIISQRQSVARWRSPSTRPPSAFTNNHLKCKVRADSFIRLQQKMLRAVCATPGQSQQCNHTLDGGKVYSNSLPQGLLLPGQMGQC